MSSNRILIVDDEAEITKLIEDVARESGYESRATTDVADFRRLVETTRPSHIFLDLNMPGSDGIQLLRFLAEKQSKAQIVIMSGFDKKIIESARQLGIARGLTVAGILSKPIRTRELAALLNEIRDDHPSFDSNDISRAIEQDELTLYFQPKVKFISSENGMNSGTEVIGFESLVRWEHPTYGLVPPMEFIPLAEATGLMERMTEKIFDMALQFINRVGIADEGHTVSINISAENLHDVDFADRLANKCSEAGVSPTSIVLELTETAAMRDVAMAMDILTRLRIKGFNLSMDDFGTGYSSLVQLHRMPFSELKIDRTFCRDGLKSDQDRTIMKAMITLAHNLGLSVVAEGIESEDVLYSLRDMECDVAQGYFIARPMPSHEIAEWMERGTAGKDGTVAPSFG